MPETSIEILLRARDEATQTINRAMSGLHQATLQAAQSQGQLVVSSGRMSVAAVGLSRNLGAAASSARFLGFTVLNELSPALGTGASRIASLATVATLGGSAMTALAVVAGGALVIALTQYFQAAKKAREEQEALNKAILEGNVEKLIDNMIALEPKIEAARAKLARFAEGGREVAFDRAQAERELNDLLEQQDRINQRAAAQGARRLEIEAAVAKGKKDSAKEEFDLAEAMRVSSEATRELAEVTERLNRARGRGLGVIVPEETLAGAQAELKEFIDSMRRAEEDAEKAAEFTLEESQRRIDETFRLVRERGEALVGAMRSLGNSAADALFDALLGRRGVFKAAAESLAREVFRNTMLFGGRSQGLSLGQLF